MDDIENGSITNSVYQKEFNVSRVTATRNLTDLIEKGILKSSGKKGSGSNYFGCIVIASVASRLHHSCIIRMEAMIEKTR